MMRPRLHQRSSGSRTATTTSSRIPSPSTATTAYSNFLLIVLLAFTLLINPTVAAAVSQNSIVNCDNDPTNPDCTQRLHPRQRVSYDDPSLCGPGCESDLCCGTECVTAASQCMGPVPALTVFTTTTKTAQVTTTIRTTIAAKVTETRLITSWVTQWASATPEAVPTAVVAQTLPPSVEIPTQPVIGFERRKRGDLGLGLGKRQMRTITSIITATYFVGPTVTVTNTVTGTSRATGDDDDLETTTVESTVLATITISPGKIVSGPPSDEAKGKKKRGSSGAIIGGVIGGVIGCALLIVGAVWWRKRKHQEQRGEKPHGGPWQFRSGGARGGGSHRGIVRLMMRDEDGAGANSPLAPAGAAKSNGTAVTHQEKAPAVTSTTPRASVIRNSLTPSGYPLSPSEPPYSPEFTHATATTITVLSPPQIYEHRNSASLSNNSNSNSKRNTMDPPAEIEAGAVTINRTQTPPPRINAPSPVSPHLSFDGNFPMSPVSPMDDVGSLRGYGDSGAGMASLSGSISSCSIGPAAYTRSRGASTGEDGMLSLQPSTKRVAGQVKRKPVPGTADSA